MTKGVSATGKNFWETPRDLILACEKRFGSFDLDVCATKQNCKAPAHFDETMDGLERPWFDRKFASNTCWMNPPYTVGKKSVIGDWVQKAIEESQRGATVIALLINDPSTKWFRLAHDNCAEMWFLLGPRIRFEIGGKPNGSGTQTHVIAVFKKTDARRIGGFWDWRSGYRSDRK